MSLLLWVAVIPILRLLPGSQDDRELRAQRAVHWFSRAFLRCLRLLRLCHIHCTGSERLREPGVLVVANHPTLLDALVLMSLMPQADCVVKDRLYEHALLGGSAKGAGYLSSRDGPALVAECVERLRRGRSVIIFPEGTRSPANELGPFARGAAHIALRAGREPLPVTVRCEPPTLHRGQAWWEVPDRAFSLILEVGEPLPIKDIANQAASQSRAARELTAVLRDYFERRLAIV